MRNTPNTLQLLGVVASGFVLASCVPAEGLPSNEALGALIGGIVLASYSTQKASVALAEKGFACYPAEAASNQVVCRRKVPNGLVCSQIQFAYLPASSAAVGKIETKLGSVCL
ncbi:MAG: hypothetical protein ACMG50_08375 [Thermomonas sp.]